MSSLLIFLRIDLSGSKALFRLGKETTIFSKKICERGSHGEKRPSSIAGTKRRATKRWRHQTHTMKKNSVNSKLELVCGKRTLIIGLSGTNAWSKIFAARWPATGTALKPFASFAFMKWSLYHQCLMSNYSAIFIMTTLSAIITIISRILEFVRPTQVEFWISTWTRNRTCCSREAVSTAKYTRGALLRQLTSRPSLLKSVHHLGEKAERCESSLDCTSSTDFDTVALTAASCIKWGSIFSIRTKVQEMRYKHDCFGSFFRVPNVLF